MSNKLLDFLESHRIAVLGVLQKDNTVHSASLHYALVEKPLSFVFRTEKASLKCKDLLNGEETSASLVIGFSEEEFVTFQAKGTVQIVSDQSTLDQVQTAYYQKYPQREKNKENPKIATLVFTPTWWRLRDYKTEPVEEELSH